ncbi:hypothetical protein [Oricola thermophila]|uniref:Uncharacterized protein n=1 Tax=Oricola thermophila TaxID=2742145 RepID=A0A6N1VJP0_9HYPH|nr:hypothetical protein [Oricola thermophila]QKV19632.1 hypothetical protein HTY61_14815 [Oricola thermophila]
MSRSALLDLLPDLSSGDRHFAPPRAPGFEPLVEAAGSREEFAVLGMPAGFSGVASEPGIGSEPDSCVEHIMAPDIDLSGERTSLDVATEESLANAGLTTELPVDIANEPEEADSDSVDPDAIPHVDTSQDRGEEDVAAGLPMHELLEAAHRAEIGDIERAHQYEIAELFSTKLPRLRGEVVEAVAGELAPLLAATLREAQAEKVLNSFVAEIGAMLEGGEALQFELHGPAHLISAFKEMWPENDVPVKYVVADGADLLARIDKTVIATRLSEVDRLIQEALR